MTQLSPILIDEVIEPEFDEALHAYTVNGAGVPSVTQLMQPLTSCVYGSINADVLRAAAEFGTAVHACTELLDEDDLDPESVEPDWMPYLDAYKAWKADVSPVIDAIELRLGCSRYCGTIDRLCIIAGEPWVVDLKTTSTLHEHVGVQLAAYEALAARKFGQRYRRAALQLRGDGTYRFREYRKPDDAACFAALLNLNFWMKNHGYR